MSLATAPPRSAGAAQSFGEVAREVVRTPGSARFHLDGYALSTVFQPIYCVRRGASTGEEAFLRAMTADGQPLHTRALFAALEPRARTRLDWICRAIHLRNHAVVDGGRRKLHLNVDPRALVDDAEEGRGFAELVRFYGLSPQRVVLEIVETESGDEERLAHAAAAHRELGFTLALDHFGEGRSNLDRVAALRPKLVKMDHAVLREALGESKARRRMPVLIEMLKDSGAQVVVKGIEASSDALAAMEAGASYLQGFHLGAPTRSPRDESLARDLIASARRLVTA